MKKKSLALIGFGLIIGGAFALGGANYIFLQQGGAALLSSPNFPSSQSNQFHQNLEFQQSWFPDEINTIKISNNFGPITIKTSPDDQIHLQLTGYQPKNSAPQYQLSSQNKVLSLETNQLYEDVDFSFPFFSNGNNLGQSVALSVELLLPATAEFREIDLKNISEQISLTAQLKTQELEIETAAGKISTGDIFSQNCTFDIISGNIESQNLQCNELEIENISGNINLNQLTSSNIARIKSVSGDLKINEINSQDLFFESISGNMNTSHGSIKSLHFNSVSGDLRLNQTQIGNLSEYKNISGEIK